MEMKDDNEHIKRRAAKRLYKYRWNHVKLLEPVGNRLRNLECPVPRSGHRIVSFKGNVFAFGGYSPRHPETNEIIQPPDNRHLFKELWKFNFATRTWLNLQTSGQMPSELASHAAVLINNFMLVYGGTGVPFGQSSSNSTHLCNLDTLEWLTLCTTGDKPVPLYGQAVAYLENKLYVVGGTTGYAYTNSVHCLDLQTNEWMRLDNLKRQQFQPPQRYRHEIVIHDDKIFVFGGGTAVESFDFKKIPVFSLVDYTWSITETSAETTAGYPQSRLCHGCMQIEDDVYICGGHDGTTIFADVWKINLRQLQWIKLDISLPLPLYFHSVATSKEGQVFIFGGVTDTHEEIRTNDIYTMWLKIPSLTEMCWQALLTYIPNIGQLDKNKLFQAGVPRHYLDQVEFFKSSDQKNLQCCKLVSS